MTGKMTIESATLTKTNLYLAIPMLSAWFECFERKKRQLKGSRQLTSETKRHFNVFFIIAKAFTEIRDQLMPAV